MAPPPRHPRSAGRRDAGDHDPRRARPPSAPAHRDSAFGKQICSLRPNSAQSSFSCKPRERCEDGTPGPGKYTADPRASSAVTDPAAAVFGTGPRGTFPEPYQYTSVQDGEGVPDGKEKYKNAPRCIFDKAGRDKEVTDPELVRLCPQARHGLEDPGFIYESDDRKVRPRSASYTMRGRGAEKPPQPPPQAPSESTELLWAISYEKAIGAQCNSRRRNARASSFCRAQRFPDTRHAEGELTSECTPVVSSFGRGNCEGKKIRNAPRATFGSARRENSAPIRTVGDDRPVNAPQRLHHPPIAPRKEILKYSSGA